MLLETDSPYLSPIRGTKNEPKNVKLVCEYLSNLLNIPFDDVASKTTLNAMELFKIDV